MNEHTAEKAEVTDEPFPPPFPERSEHADPCPACGHSLGIHAREIGCVHGWTYDIDGHVQTEGCECHLSLSDNYNPPSEVQV